MTVENYDFLLFIIFEKGIRIIIGTIFGAKFHFSKSCPILLNFHISYPKNFKV